jgi:hypothetical protein
MRNPSLAALAALVLMLPLGGCVDYDRYSIIADQDGLVPPDVFARYGAEQAQSVAIGRALASSSTGGSTGELARAVEEAARYAMTLPDVVSVTPDAQARILTVTFRSGWQKAITPIPDGVPADRTPGLPPRQ